MQKLHLAARLPCGENQGRRIRESKYLETLEKFARLPFSLRGGNFAANFFRIRDWSPTSVGGAILFFLSF